MRKYGFFLLCLGILLSAVGCGTAGSVTPTGASSQITASSSTLTSEIAASSDTPSKAAEASVLASTSNNNKTVSSAVAKQPQNVKKPSASSLPVASKSEPSTSKVVAAKVPPEGFTNEGELKNWLLSGSPKEQERINMLQAVGNNNTISYFRPNISADNNLLTLKRIDTYSETSTRITYSYNLIEHVPDYAPIDLRISCYLSGSDVGFFEDAKEELEQGNKKIYSVICNQIEYIYRKNDNSVSFYWKQYGREHYAMLENNHADLIDEILPLLNLQKVTYRTDVVDQ